MASYSAQTAVCRRLDWVCHKEGETERTDCATETKRAIVHRSTRFELSPSKPITIVSVRLPILGAKSARLRTSKPDGMQSESLQSLTEIRRSLQNRRLEVRSPWGAPDSQPAIDRIWGKQMGHSVFRRPRSRCKSSTGSSSEPHAAAAAAETGSRSGEVKPRYKLAAHWQRAGAVLKHEFAAIGATLWAPPLPRN